jgi:predicted nuclease with TOPRIM domain
MRHMPTIQGLPNRVVPVTREQAVTELARLEHEKARVQREMTTWQENQRKAEERLQQVEERISLLREMLFPNAHDSATACSEGSLPAGDQHDTGESETHTWQAMKMEY